MNSRKNKTILATVASIAIIFAIGSCHDNPRPIDRGPNTTDTSTSGKNCNDSSNPIDSDNNTTDTSASGRDTTLKTQGYKIFTQNQLQGVQDSQGKVLIPAQYNKIESVNLQQNYAIATHKGLQGAIDLEGKVLMPFEYDSITTKFDNLDLLSARKDIYHDLYNLRERRVVFSNLESIGFFFSNINCNDVNYGIASKNWKKGIVDLRGEIQIPFEYDDIDWLSSLEDDATVFIDRNGKQGIKFYGTNNKPIPPEYDRIDYINFRDGYGIVTKDRQTGVYDLKQDRFTPLEYDEIELVSPGEYDLNTFFNKKANSKIIKDEAIALVNEDGKTRLLLQNFLSTRSQYFVVTKNDRKGILNINNGELTIPIEYDSIYLSHNTTDYAIGTLADRRGILNIKERTFIPINAEEINTYTLELGYAVFTQQDRDGIVNLEGEVVIPAQFDSISSSKPIANKYLIASQNQRKGLLNLQTKQFTAFDYENISEGRLEPNYLIAIDGDKQGIINLQGNLIVPLAEGRIVGYRDGVILRKYGDSSAIGVKNPSAPIPSRVGTKGKIKTNSDSRDLFIDDIAVLNVVDGLEDNYFCVIDRQGKLLFEAKHPNWDASEKINNLCRSFVGIEVDNNSIGEDPLIRNGVKIYDLNYDFLVRNGFIVINVNGKYGHANVKGNIVVYPQFDSVSSYFDEEGLASVKQNGQWGFVDRTGQIVIKPQFDSVEDFEEGLAAVEQNDKWGFIDRTGQIVIKPQFDSVRKFKEGFAVVEQNGQWGFVNRMGEITTKPQFNLVSDFEEGLAMVEQNGQWGFVERTGKIVLEPQFDSVRKFKEGLAGVEQNDKWGFVERTGKIVLEPQFDNVTYFVRGLAAVKQNNKSGLVDRTGKIIFKPQFDSFELFDEGLVRVEQNGKWGFVDRTGKIIIEPQFDGAEPFRNGIATVRKGDREYDINTKGKIVSDPSEVE